MKALLERVRSAIASGKQSWTQNGETVTVRFSRNARGHQVRLGRRDDLYVLSAIVLPAAEVTASDEQWRNIAYKAWRRNSMTELVTFAFDNEDRLIGLIEVPVATLDREELEAYIDTLARECDRFEFALTGQDRH